MDSRIAPRLKLSSWARWLLFITQLTVILSLFTSGLLLLAVPFVWCTSLPRRAKLAFSVFGLSLAGSLFYVASTS